MKIDLSEDLKVKITLVLFLFSIGRLVYFFMSGPDVVGDYKRDAQNMIQDQMSVYEIIVAKPLQITEKSDADKKTVSAEDKVETPAPKDRLVSETAAENKSELQPTAESASTDLPPPPTEDDIEPPPLPSVENLTEEETVTNKTSEESEAVAESETENPTEDVAATPSSDATDIDELINDLTSIKDPTEEASQKEVPESLKRKVLEIMTCKQENSGNPMNPVVWRLMVRKAGQETFTTREPAGLPEISKQVFGEEECWPKIWSLNPGITNPYDVPKDTEISFFPSK